MAELTIEVDDKGNVGTLPEPLQKFFDTRINDAYRRGAEKTEERLKGAMKDPAEIERLKALEEENSRFKEDKAKAEKNWEEAHKVQADRFTKQIEERDSTLTAKEQEIARRDTRLRQMLGSEIRAAAAAAGARDESLPELVKLLGADLDLDTAELTPFVKGEDGKPRTDKDGKPVTIEGYVAQYLADHPHHLAGRRGQPGRAQGGASMRGVQVGGDSKDDAIAAAQENPSEQNVTRAIGSIRKKAS